MATSLIRYQSFYPSSGAAMDTAAAVDDVLVVAIMGKSLTSSAATCSGATVTLVEQQFQAQAGGNNNGITILTGVVTGAGTPSISFTPISDGGWQAWILRGPTSGTKNAGNGAGGTGTTLTASASPTGTTDLIIAWLNEGTDAFTSFNGSISQDGHDTGHWHAGGHEFGVSAGTYSPGISCSSSNDNTIAFIYLPAGAPPTVDTQPVTAYVAEGATATLSITATGATSYQWEQNDGAGWGNVSGGSGGTTASYTTPAAAVATMNGRRYRCNAINADGTTTSSEALLWISVEAPVGMFDPLMRAECWFDGLMA